MLNRRVYCCITKDENRLYVVCILHFVTFVTHTGSTNLLYTSPHNLNLASQTDVAISVTTLSIPVQRPVLLPCPNHQS